MVPVVFNVLEMKTLCSALFMNAAVSSSFNHHCPQHIVTLQDGWVESWIRTEREAGRMTLQLESQGDATVSRILSPVTSSRERTRKDTVSKGRDLGRYGGRREERLKVTITARF